MKQPLVIVLAFLLCTVRAEALITVTDSDYISNATASGASGTSVLTVTAAAGDTIVACGQNNNVSGTANAAMSFADDRGNSYSTPYPSVPPNGSLLYTKMAYAMNVPSGSTTVTMSLIDAGWRGLYVVVLHGTAITAVLDTQDARQNNSSTTPSTIPMTATSAGAAVGCMHMLAATTVTAGSGWTTLQEDEAFTNVAGSLIWRTTTAGSYTANWTLGASTEWVAVSQIFLEFPAPPSPSYTLTMLGVMNSGVGLGPGPGSGTDFGGYRAHYQGYGTETMGAWGGGMVPLWCRVNTLTDNSTVPAGSGSDRNGSLRGCLQLTVPRIIVFETSGTILLGSILVITNPYFTIAGHTAPDPGVNIRNWGMYIDTHDGVVQHLRFRYGDTSDTSPGNNYVLNVGIDNSGVNNPKAYNIVFDHISCAFTMYLCFTLYDVDGASLGQVPNHPYNVSLLDSLFAFGLAKNITYGGMGGGLAAPGYFFEPETLTRGNTLARALFVHNSHRLPIFGSGRRQQLINSITYGSGPGSAGYYAIMAQPLGDAGGDSSDYYRREVVAINNWFIPTLNTGSGVTAGSDGANCTFHFAINQNNLTYQNSRYWLSGNTGPCITGTTQTGQWDGVERGLEGNGVWFTKEQVMYSTEPSWQTSFTWRTIATATTPAAIFANVGARPLSRDAIDTAAVAQATAGYNGDTANMGRRITSQNDTWAVVGTTGHVTLAVNTRTFNIPSNPNNTGNCGNWAGGVARPIGACFLENDATFGAQRVESYQIPPP